VGPKRRTPDRDRRSVVKQRGNLKHFSLFSFYCPVDRSARVQDCISCMVLVRSFTRAADGKRRSMIKQSDGLNYVS
jgi:hypothetical protein